MKKLAAPVTSPTTLSTTAPPTARRSPPPRPGYRSRNHALQRMSLRTQPTKPAAGRSASWVFSEMAAGDTSVGSRPKGAGQAGSMTASGTRSGASADPEQQFAPARVLRMRCLSSHDTTVVFTDSPGSKVINIWLLDRIIPGSPIRRAVLCDACGIPVPRGGVRP